MFNTTVEGDDIANSPSERSGSAPFLVAVTTDPNLLARSPFPYKVTVPSPVPIMLSSSLGWAYFL